MKTDNPRVKGQAIPLGQPLSPNSFKLAELFALELRKGINDIIYKAQNFSHQRTVMYSGAYTTCGPVELSAYRTRSGGYKIVVELDDDKYRKPWDKDLAPMVADQKAANHFRGQKHKTLVRLIERTILRAQNEAPLWEMKRRAWQKINAIKRAYPDSSIAELEHEMAHSGRSIDWDNMEADEAEGWLKWATEYKSSTKTSLRGPEFRVDGVDRDESGPRGQKPSAARLPDLAQFPVREVPILARGDDGLFHVTPEYYSLNPNEGETVRTEKGHNEALALAQIIEEAIVDVVDVRPAYGESVHVDVGYIVRKAFPHVHQGDVFDWGHIQMTVDAGLRTRLGLTSKEEGLSARVPKHYTAYFLHLEQTIWWWQRAQDNEKLPLGGPIFPTMHIGNPDGKLCEVDGPYVGLDQYKNCGAPTFSPMCGNCMALLEPRVNKDGKPDTLVCEMCSRPMPAKDFIHQFCGECAAMKGPMRDERWATKPPKELNPDFDTSKPPMETPLPGMEDGPMSDEEQRAKLLNVPKVSRVAITGWINNRWQIEDAQVAQGEFKVYFSDSHYTLGLEKFDTYHDGTSQMYKVRMILLGPDGTLESPDILFEDVIDIPGYGSFIEATGPEAAEVALTRTLKPSLWASTQRRRKFWASTETIHIRRWIERILAQQPDKESVEGAENDGVH